MKKKSVFQGTMHNMCKPYTAPRLAVIRSCVGPFSLHCATSTWMHMHVRYNVAQGCTCSKAGLGRLSLAVLIQRRFRQSNQIILTCSWRSLSYVPIYH
jgi:hypothetical protein